MHERERKIERESSFQKAFHLKGKAAEHYVMHQR